MAQEEEKPRLSDRVRTEIYGISLLIAGILLALALVSYTSTDPSFHNSETGLAKNYIGVAGSHISDLLIQFFGISAYLIPLAVLVFAVRFIILKPIGYPFWVSFGYSVLTLSLSAFFELRIGKVDFDADTLPAGGALGDLFGNSLSALFGGLGANLILATVILCSLMFTVNFSVLTYGENLWAKISDLRERRREKKEQKEQEAWESRSKKTKLKAEIAESAPKIIAEEIPQPKPKQLHQESFEFVREVNGYILPPDDIFDKPDGIKRGPDQESLLMSSKLLLKKLLDFGVEGTVETVRPGPVVTMFEFKPASGVKINKIVNLSDDLALALRALSIRIVAPIPGKDTVGIEIPNSEREMVTIREVFSSNEYLNSKSRLTIALGKDIAGNPVVADLAKMPHLLIAGATGSGKSVAVHTMIASLLKRATPSEVKLLIVDPKMLELSVYDDIPHLLLPVVTEAKKAATALRWAVREMENRYRMMAEEGVRNITSYNSKVDKITTPEGGFLPYIVVIIDELADLMMVAGKEVEESIARLAQMARAAGIHLIVATQRPSVDVITGMIKANFPARMAFQVASRVDSRTILDSMGAETLLGGGDMLFLPPGSAKLMRAHGSFVSEKEISRLVTHIKAQAPPEYKDEILEEPEVGEYESEDEADDLYDQAVAFVTETRQASVSMVQRKFRIGYNRAARLVEIMEKEGVVGPSRGAKPREVLARKL